jgi:AcrR family transcriptional regulator
MTPTARRRPKAQAIAQSALSLFAERGVASSTTREIAKRARTTEGNIYRYYESKDHLARSVMASCLVELGKFLSRRLESATSPRERLATFVRAYVAFAREHPREHALVVEAHGIGFGDLPEDMLRPRRILVDLIVEGISRGDVRREDPRLLAAFIAGGLARAVRLDLAAGGNGTESAFAEDLVRLVLAFVERKDEVVPG